MQAIAAPLPPGPPPKKEDVDVNLVPSAKVGANRTRFWFRGVIEEEVNFSC